MRLLLSFVPRTVLICLFMAILRVRALAVILIPHEALPETLQILDADDAPSASGWRLGPEGVAPSPAAPLPVRAPPIPTETHMLPSHIAEAPSEARRGSPGRGRGHAALALAPGTQWAFHGETHDSDSDSDSDADVEGHAVVDIAQHPYHTSNSAPWADSAKPLQRSGPRRRLPGDAGAGAGTDTDASDSDSDGARGRDRHARITSDESRVSVLAVAVVGVVLACHYLDYL